MWYPVTNSDMNRVLYCPRHAETHVAALTVQVAEAEVRMVRIAQEAVNEWASASNPPADIYRLCEWGQTLVNLLEDRRAHPIQQKEE